MSMRFTEPKATSKEPMRIYPQGGSPEPTKDLSRGISMSNEKTFIQQSSEWIHKPKDIDANLKDYFKIYKTFKWKSVEKEFDWYKTKKINIVHIPPKKRFAGRKVGQKAGFKKAVVTLKKGDKIELFEGV